MKIKVIRKNLFKIWQAINSDVDGAKLKLKYALSRNISLLEKIVEDTQKSGKTSVEKYKEYENQLRKLVSKYTYTGEERAVLATAIGNITVNREQSDAIVKELSGLDVKYAAAIKKREKEIEEFESFLDEEIDVEVFGISVQWIPESIPGSVLSGILPLLLEKTSEVEKYFMSLED